jgi:hypothetical protein
MICFSKPELTEDLHILQKEEAKRIRKKQTDPLIREDAT